MKIKEVINEKILAFMQCMTRRKINISFNDLSRSQPVSKVFGSDRGTSIDRYYISKFISKNSNLIKGRVLEVADTRYSKRFGGNRVETFEVLHVTPGNPSATIVGNLTDPSTLPENRIDCFICTQTFNFIFDLKKAVVGAHFLLKPGGVLLATVSGISRISRYDMERWGDYWRFTIASAQRLFEPVFQGGVAVESFGNVLAAVASLQGVAVEDLPNAALLDEHDPDYQVIIAIIARKGH